MAFENNIKALGNTFAIFEMVLNTRRNTISKHDSVAKTYGLAF